MMDSYDVIAEAVRSYWEDNYPQDVIAFFQQKYSWDDKWERCEELVECHGCDDYENMTFLSDFCEGQTEVKDVIIVPLREVTGFYSSMQKKIHTNADRIRSMTNEELANYLSKFAKRIWDKPPSDKLKQMFEEKVVWWLKKEVTK